MFKSLYVMGAILAVAGFGVAGCESLEEEIGQEELIGAGAGAAGGALIGEVAADEPLIGAGVGAAAGGAGGYLYDEEVTE